MRSPRSPLRGRRAFTLIEMVFATTLGALVLSGIAMLLLSMQRNQQMVVRRAEDAAALGRLRLVFQRAFGDVLMAPAPSTRTNRTATAQPTGQPTGQPSDPQAPQAADPQAAQPRGMLAILDEARATTPPRMLLERAATSTLAMNPIAHLELPAAAPQRLELVLIDAPVPVERRDPFELAKAVRRVAERQAKERERARATQGQPATASPVDTRAQNDEPDEDEESLSDVRAVRGSFELRPEAPALTPDDDEAPTLWELWWVPAQARRTIAEMRELSRAERLIESVSAGEPYRIASGLRSLRYRVVEATGKSDEFAGVFRQDIPSYVEVDVEMRSGLTAQWLFEMGVQTGQEVAQPAQQAASGQATTGEASGSDAAQTPSTLPMRTMQPAQQRPGIGGSKPGGGS